MGPQHLLMTVLLVAYAKPTKASQFCSYLASWNPDKKCCFSCLEHFGPPPCPDQEFIENCGMSDTGDYRKYPFRNCSPGQCNPDGAELCRPCGAPPSAPTSSQGGTQSRCRKRPIPPKKPCNRAFTKAAVLPTQEISSPVLPTQEISSPATSSLWRPTYRQHTSKGRPFELTFLNFTLPVVVVFLVAFLLILLLAVQRQCGWECKKPDPLPLLCSSQDPPVHLHLPSSGSLKASELGCAHVSLLPFRGTELLALEKQPVSRLLDELEVLEELIVLLDPEPGPGGTPACGTTRHLAARYGLPSAWSNFAYSLRPSRSPLRALLEMVVAKEPTASLGQFAVYLTQVGRADALQVLAKLK